MREEWPENKGGWVRGEKNREERNEKRDAQRKGI